MSSTIKLLSGLFALGMTCCGGAPFDVAPQDSQPLTATCQTFGSNLAFDQDGGVIGAASQATTEQTACMSEHCLQAATCGDRTAAMPVCVDYANGGIMLSLWVCPVGCCY